MRMDGQSIEINAAQASEELKLQVKKTLSSQFSLLPEAIDLPAELKQLPEAKEHVDDVGFRTQVEKVLPSVLSDDKKVLVIENIATQHAVATTPAYLAHNIDSYFAFIPEGQNIRPELMKGSYYHPERVIEVALANQERINQMKTNMAYTHIKGVRVILDPHASFELEAGLFSRFFPSEDKLQELGIQKIVMLGEFPPENANGLIERRINRKEEWDKSPIYEYLRTMKSRGYEVRLLGLDTRTYIVAMVSI